MHDDFVFNILPNFVDEFKMNSYSICLCSVGVARHPPIFLFEGVLLSLQSVTRIEEA